MGNKKADAKKLIDTIDKTIRQLEQRMAELQGETDPETGKLTQRAKKELSWVSRHLSLVKSARDEVQETMERAKTEEEKKRIMNVVALAMLVGAINENLRLSEERMRRENCLIAFITPFFEEVKEALFASHDFRFVTENDVKEILADEELRQMAEEDPDRLEREEQDYREEYKSMISHALDNAAITEGEDFEENEERFREFLRKNNGYEFVLNRSGQFIRENILAENGIAPEEDRIFFAEVMEELEDLRKTTRELQEQYILEDDSYERGNGFTKELVDREMDLVNKLEAYSKKKLDEAMQMDPNDPATMRTMTLYERARMLVTPVMEQQKRDRILQRNNDLRRRMERWTVYQQLPGDDRPEVIQETIEIRNRKAAVAKLRRIERMAVKRSMEEEKELTDIELKERANALREGHGSLHSITATWAVEETETLLERLEEDRPLTKDDLPEIRKALAALVLQQLILDDVKRPEGEPRCYYDAVRRSMSHENFLEVTGELARSAEFKKALDPLIKGKNMKENVYRFLANDFERITAKRTYEGRKVKKVKPAKGKEAKPAKGKEAKPAKEGKAGKVIKGHH